MTETLTLGGNCIEQSSDSVFDIYCEPCYDLDSIMKSVVGYCNDCSEGLCLECFTAHRRPMSFRNHRLINNSSMNSINLIPSSQTQLRHFTDKCHRHHNETINSFCRTHSEMCCKVCITVYHQLCEAEEITTMSQNVDTSQELKILKNKLDTLKSGFTKLLGKTKDSDSPIQNDYSEVILEIKKLQEEFNQLMTETKHQADKIKEKGMKKMDSVSMSCNVVIEQIDNIFSNMDFLQSKKENKSLFISMKNAEGELLAFEASPHTLGEDSVIREYKFEPDVKLQGMLSDIKALGNLILFDPTTDNEEVSLCERTANKSTHVKYIKTKSDQNLGERGTVALRNNQILKINEQNKKLQLIHTFNCNTISEIQLSGKPYDVTEINTNEFAVIVKNPNKIQLYSVLNYSLSHQRDIAVNGEIRGMAYNDKERAFIVSFLNQTLRV